MNAADLRAVAAEIREKAEPMVRRTPWVDDRGRVLLSNGQFVVARGMGMLASAHIAAWHPAVAIAVAVMLDERAEAYETQVDPEYAAGPRHGGDCDSIIGDRVSEFGCHCFDAAFAFVAAWRGESS